MSQPPAPPSASLSPEQFVSNFLVEGHVLEVRGIRDVLTPKVKATVVDRAEALPELTADRHWYVTVCAHKRPASGSTSASTAAASNALWADLDHVTVEEALRRLHVSGLPQPNILINSGNGVHAYWLLTNPIVFDAAEGRMALKGTLRRLAGLLGGDRNVADVARVMRIPGTLNLKDPDHPKPCIVVSLSRARVDYDAFVALMAPLASLTRLWTEGRRNSLTLALSGFWKHHNASNPEGLYALLRQICEAAGDGEVEGRLATARKTFEKDKADVAFKAHFAAAFSDAPYVVEWLMEELRSAKARHEGGPLDALGGDEADDAQPVNKSYVELPGGRIAEEINTAAGPAFAVYDPATDTVEVVSQVEAADGVIKPVPIPANLRECLTIADGVEEYGSTKALIAEMEELAQVFDPVTETAMWRMWIRGALVSWIIWPIFEPVVERFASIYRITGPSESGKGRALTVCRFCFYRPLYFLKTTRVPSLFRAIDSWWGTLILDEADTSNSGESAEFIQFLNARAVGSVIPRYSSEADANRYFMSYGNTVVATRKPYQDDGVNSRTVPLRAEATVKNDIPLVPTAEWVLRGRCLQRKLLLWRLRHIAKIKKGELKVPSSLKIAGVSSFRVKESFLVLRALADEEPDLVADMEAVGRELERRLVVERAASPEGLILNAVYGCLDDGDWRVERVGAPDGVAYRLVREVTVGEGADSEVETVPLKLTSISDMLGKAFSSSEIARYWRGLGQVTKERDRVGGHLHRGILLISDPARLDREFFKFVVDAKSKMPLFPKGIELP